MRLASRALIGSFCLVAVTLFLPAQNQPGMDAGTVFLAVTVTDSKHNAVTSLKAEDFTVYEDGKEQRISSVSREDAPVSIGFLVDNSGSMRHKRPLVVDSLMHLVEAANPQDEIFVVNFSDEPYIDQDFTSDRSLVRKALVRAEPRGGTALNDAVIAASDHMTQSAKYQKRILIVVTDGADNESRKTLIEAIAALQSMNGPTAYTVGILDEQHAGASRRALESLSTQSGGGSYFINDARNMEKAMQNIGKEIGSHYGITYTPTNPQSNAGFRRITVKVNHNDWKVRTKAGYSTEQARSAKKGQ